HDIELLLAGIAEEGVLVVLAHHVDALGRAKCLDSKGADLETAAHVETLPPVARCPGCERRCGFELVERCKDIALIDCSRHLCLLSVSLRRHYRCRTIRGRSMRRHVVRRQETTSPRRLRAAGASGVGAVSMR